MDPMDFQMEPGHPGHRSGGQSNAGYCPALTQSPYGGFPAAPNHDSRYGAGGELYAFGSWDNSVSRHDSRQDGRLELPHIRDLYHHSSRHGYGSHPSRATSRPSDHGDPMVTDMLDPTAPVYQSPSRLGSNNQAPVHRSGQSAQNNATSPRSRQAFGGHESGRLPSFGQFEVPPYTRDFNSPNSYSNTASVPHRMALPLPSSSHYTPQNYFPNWSQQDPAGRFSSNRASIPQDTAQLGWAVTPDMVEAQLTSLERNINSLPDLASPTDRQPGANIYSLGGTREDSDMSSAESDEGSMDDSSGIAAERRILTGIRASVRELAGEIEEYVDPMQERHRAARRALNAQALAKPVASTAAIASLEKVEKTSLEREDINCIICYNEFGIINPDGNVESPVRLPKCKHLFGDHCLKKWLKQSDSCPYCRDKLDSTPNRRIAAEAQRSYYASMIMPSNIPHGSMSSSERAEHRSAFLARYVGDGLGNPDRDRARFANMEEAEIAAHREHAMHESTTSSDRRADNSSRHRRGRISSNRAYNASASGLQASQQFQQQLQSLQRHREHNLERARVTQRDAVQGNHRTQHQEANRMNVASFGTLRPIQSANTDSTILNENTATGPRSITPYPVVDPTESLSSPTRLTNTATTRPSSLPSERSPLNQVSYSPVESTDHSRDFVSLPSGRTSRPREEPSRSQSSLQPSGNLSTFSSQHAPSEVGRQITNRNSDVDDRPSWVSSSSGSEATTGRDGFIGLSLGDALRSGFWGDSESTGIMDASFGESFAQDRPSTSQSQTAAYEEDFGSAMYGRTRTGPRGTRRDTERGSGTASEREREEPFYMQTHRQ